MEEVPAAIEILAPLFADSGHINIPFDHIAPWIGQGQLVTFAKLFGCGLRKELCPQKSALDISNLRGWWRNCPLLGIC
jgi:hypothetical protein